MAMTIKECITTMKAEYELNRQLAAEIEAKGEDAPLRDIKLAKWYRGKCFGIKQSLRWLSETGIIRLTPDGYEVGDQLGNYEETPKAEER